MNSPSDADDAVPPAVPERYGRMAMAIVATATAILLVQYMQAVLLPLVLSGLLFYALDTPVDRLHRLHVPRALAAAIVLSLTVGGAGLLAVSLQGQFLAVVDRLPQGARNLARTLERRPSQPAGPLDKVQEAAEALSRSTGNGVTPGVMRVQIEEPAFRANQYLWQNSFGALSLLNRVLMVLFLTYFMLLSGQLFRRKLLKIAGPTLSRRKVTVEILEQIDTRIKQFLLIQMATSAIVAVTTWLVLWALGLEQAAFWGLIAGILNSIPYYGPLLVTGGLSIVGYLQFGDVGRTAAVAGASLLITTLEGSFITPQLMGRAAEMNTVAVFAGLIFWTWTWGVWGLLLAVPMMMVLKVICDHVEDLEPVGHLLGK